MGLDKPDEGTILVDGEDITKLDEQQLAHVRKKIGMVFQESALFDSLTVRENVGFQLYEEGVDEEEIDRKVREVLGSQLLGAVADRGVGLRVDLDDDPVRPGCGGGKRHRLDEIPLPGRVTRVDDHGQMGQLLERRDRH